MEILVLLVLIVLNGFFAMSEIALVTARGSRLARLAEDGDRAAEAALRLNADPTRVLSTIQIGITAIGILNGIFGEAALAVPLAKWLQTFGVDRSTSEIGATLVVVVCITYVSIVVGELVPKRIGQFNAEVIARLVAGPISVLARLSYPFVRLLSLSTEGILDLMGKNRSEAPDVTEEDIEAMMEEGSGAGVFDVQERDLVKNVFRLDDRLIGSLMVPQSEVEFLDVENTDEENRAILLATRHARLPVCRGEMQEILGIAAAKDLLVGLLESGTLDLTSGLTKAVFVPHVLSGSELLERFRQSELTMMFVLDEFGAVMGLVTLQDVLDAIVGEFGPQVSEEALAIAREDGSWLLDGLMPIQVLAERLELKAVPDDEKASFQTLGGMIMRLLGRVPRTGDIAEWLDWRFEVVDVDGKRVDKVLASRITAHETLPAKPIPSPADRPNRE